MRHVFVTNDFPPKAGGIESFLASLASGFDPDDVCVIAPAREGHRGVDETLPYRVVRVEGKYLRAKRYVRDEIVRTARSHNADVVHFLQTVPLGRLAGSVGKELGIPTTIFVHGSEVIVPARFLPARIYIRHILRAASLVSCVSEFTAKKMAKLAPGLKIVVLEPSVDEKRFSLEVSGSAVREQFHVGSNFCVLFVSRLVKRKGADVLLQAMTQLPNAHLIVVGSGPESAALKRLAGELQLGGRVHFAGRVSNFELPAYYAAADVFCMPCNDRYGGLDTEGFGIVFLEAQATGLPCVAGVCGGSAEAVVDNETGIVIDNVTAATVAEALSKLRKDQILRMTMGSAARERVTQSFTPQSKAAALSIFVQATKR